jgi:hypothetical protein
MRRAVLSAIVLLLIGMGMAVSVTVPEHRTEYLGPVFTPDGTAVAVIRPVRGDALERGTEDRACRERTGAVRAQDAIARVR